MEQLKFAAPITIALGMATLLFSCNERTDKKVEVTTTDTTINVTAAEPEAVAKLTNVLIVQHKVANFDKWKPMYESHDSVRNLHGVSKNIIGRGMNDPNMIVIIQKIEDVNKAKELTGSAELKERMKQGGVIGIPTFTYLNVVMNDDNPIEQNARLMMSHKVKDWDAWKKEFDSHKQVRIDAGLIDRGVGYSLDNNKMVSIVFAVTDMGKVKAFLSSPDLKEKMLQASVDGPSTSLFYNIVQKY